MRSLAALALLLAATGTFAQAFPARTVRIIIANAPGVANDTIARGISQYMGPKIGQAIVVENRPGADGVIGMDACAKAPPDGHAMCITAQGAIVINPLIRPKLPYQTLRDFAPLINVGYSDSAIAVHSSVPVSTFPELLELAKQKPDSVTWAIFSFTSTGNMFAQWMKRFRGVPWFVVPYKSPPQMLQALITGEVNAGTTSLALLEKHAAAGKVKILAMTSDERHPSLPNVPALPEFGIKLPMRTWYGALMPVGTPKDLVGWWNTELTKLFEEPEFRNKLILANGLLFVRNTPEQFTAEIRRYRDSFAELIRILEIKPE